jgi:GDPmannose 4,6-dehydratase
MQKLAAITGITGQDGSYLAEYLLENGYKVYAGIRRTSIPLSSNTRLHNLIDHPNLTLINLDLLDNGSIKSFVETIKSYVTSYMTIMDNYIEVYNLAAQSHVGESFKIPVLTHQINAVAVVGLLEAFTEIFRKQFRFYQASTSELFGNEATGTEKSLSEQSSFKPTSPYAIAKLSAFLTVKHYRETYNTYAVNGILFNHESPRRGLDFVTRKITNGVAQYATGKNKGPIMLGNVHARRDWGDARDYVKAMHLMLNTSGSKITDYVVSSGETYSVKDFCNMAFEKIGIILNWQGKGLYEYAVNKNGTTKEVLIEIDSRFYRPSDVEYLLGDSTKIRENLNWQPSVSFKQLVFDMVENDIEQIKGNLFK